VGEVALGVESLGDGLMVGQLLAVVIGERVDKVGMRLQCCEQGVRDGLYGLVGSLVMVLLRSASVSRKGPPGLPITVSASQSPVRECSSTSSGRYSILSPFPR
jgi:hypothetical protein